MCKCALNAVGVKHTHDEIYYASAETTPEITRQWQIAKKDAMKKYPELFHPITEEGGWNSYKNYKKAVNAIQKCYDKKFSGQ